MCALWLVKNPEGFPVTRWLIYMTEQMRRLISFFDDAHVLNATTATLRWISSTILPLLVYTVLFFIIRGIFNIMCVGLNNKRCRFLIMHSGYIIMRCRSCKWCSVVIITCCAFVKCHATFLLCKVCFTLFAVHNCILTLNIYKHTTSSNMHCSLFVMRGIFNVRWFKQYAL